MKRSICVMVELLTDHPLLDPDTLDVESAEAREAVRAAVIESLPELRRVIMVMPTEMARIMCEAHDAACEAAGFAPRQPRHDA